MNREFFKRTVVRSPGWSPFTIAVIADGLFFPRSAELGLAVEDTISPRVRKKVVYAGTSGASFSEAERNLKNLSGISISSERVRRACRRAGEQRIDEQTRLQEAYHNKSLPEQTYGKPSDVETPEIACVMADGGRYQQLDRGIDVARPKSARKGEHWKESRIGLLATMSGAQYPCDPQPKLPPELCYQAVASKLSEMGKTGGKLESANSLDDGESVVPADGDGLSGPTRQTRSVVASRQDWESFGALLASEAWYRGFAAAPRQVFISDGSTTLAKLQQTHFAHDTSVLEIRHALSYSLGAARAVCADEASAQQQYDIWAAMIWEGRLEDVINELDRWRSQLGDPPPDARSDDPREVVRVARGYYQNHRDRMDDPRYRQAGFPLTSSLMESTVKQVSRRVKGSEKFWSSAGGEAILRLRGEYLSDDNPMDASWERRSRNADGTRAYTCAT